MRNNFIQETIYLTITDGTYVTNLDECKSIATHKIS